MSSPPRCTQAYIHAALPTVCLGFVVLVSALTKIEQGLPDCCEAPRRPPGFLDHFLNAIFVSIAGPAIPFILIPLQMYCLPYSALQKNAVIGSEHSVRCLPRDWAPALFTVWLAICVTRVFLYVAFRQWHCFFSDHIFLVTSVVSQVEMKIFLAELSHGTLGSKGCLLVSVAWCLLVPYLIVTVTTVLQFHTIQACMTAFTVGTVLFSGIAFWWSRILRLRGREQNKCALLEIYQTADEGDGSDNFLDNNVVLDKDVVVLEATASL